MLFFAVIRKKKQKTANQYNQLPQFPRVIPHRLTLEKNNA
jgi:hypothetical protein